MRTPCHPAYRPLPLLMLFMLLVLLGACAHTAAPPATTPRWMAATSTDEWNAYANDLIARNAVGQVGALRSLAYLNLAAHNAIVRARADKLSADGAVAGAAAQVLAQIFAKDAAAVTARLQREMQAIGPAGRGAFEAGVALGRQVGDEVTALARADRAAQPWSGQVPTGDDKWSSRVQPPAPPLAAALGGARTFLMTSGGEFRPGPPPPWGSDTFKAQLRQVRTIADGRTNEQLRIAQHWENLTGAYAAGSWNQLARTAMAAHGFDEPATARVLATMHMAGFDAIVACHDAKYTYWLPRPSQVDPGIQVAIALPNHPSYPSNHSCISGAMGRVLDAVLPGTQRRYENMAHQAGLSRLYGGIHYQVDLDAGDAIAARLAARALQSGPAADRPYLPAGR